MQIEKLLKQGKTPAEIEKELKISNSYVYRIRDAMAARKDNITKPLTVTVPPKANDNDRIKLATKVADLIKDILNA